MSSRPPSSAPIPGKLIRDPVLIASWQMNLQPEPTVVDKDGLQPSQPTNRLSPLKSSNQNAKEKHSARDGSDLTKTDSAAMEASLEPAQEEILPLSGSPFFTSIIMKSNAQNPYQLVVPRNFIPFLPSNNVDVTLCCRNKKWVVGYYGSSSLKRFDSRWKTFANDNKLKIGDACIFELTDGKGLQFRVQILDGSLPSPFTREPLGNKSDAPIVIDD